MTGLVVLAAGGGSRFAGGAHKLLSEWRGAPLAEQAVHAAVAARSGPVLVVTGAATRLRVPAGVLVVHHDRWADGQATSLRRAVTVAAALGWRAVVVGLADQPGIGADAWRAVASSPHPIAVAVYGDRRRNPVRLGREVWDDLPVSGDEGARTLMRLRPDLVHDVPCAGDPADIDTAEDLHRWNSSTTSP